MMNISPSRIPYPNLSYPVVFSVNIFSTDRSGIAVVSSSRNHSLCSPSDSDYSQSCSVTQPSKTWSKNHKIRTERAQDRCLED